MIGQVKELVEAGRRQEAARQLFDFFLYFFNYCTPLSRSIKPSLEKLCISSNVMTTGTINKVPVYAMEKTIEHFT